MEGWKSGSKTKQRGGGEFRIGLRPRREKSED